MKYTLLLATALLLAPLATQYSAAAANDAAKERLEVVRFPMHVYLLYSVAGERGIAIAECR